MRHKNASSTSSPRPLVFGDSSPSRRSATRWSPGREWAVGQGKRTSAACEESLHALDRRSFCGSPGSPQISSQHGISIGNLPLDCCARGRHGII
jgi:hypothetical protein